MMEGDLFKITKCDTIPDLLIFEPSVHIDHRGTLFTSYIENIVSNYLPKNLKFTHDKFSESRKDVIRGLHGDSKTWKLVSCIYGEIFQVVVDCRKKSKTYLNTVSFSLDRDQRKMILVPPNCANGYCVVSEHAIYHYKLAYRGRYSDVEDQFVLKWNDPRLKIDWPTSKPVLAERDN